MFGILNLGHCDLPFDLAQGGELVEPFGICDLLFEILELTAEDLYAIQKESKPKSGLQDCIVVLNKSYRFPEDSSIGALSRHVNRGEAEGALNLLENAADDTIVWHDMDSTVDFQQSHYAQN